MWQPGRDLLRLFLISAALLTSCPPSWAKPVSPVQDAPSSQPARDKAPDYAAPAPPARSVRTDIPLDAQARQTAERAIPFIQQNGMAWIKERRCLSCHYAGYMLWSLRDAGQRGFTVDQVKLAESANWGMSQSDQNGFGFEGAAEMLLARDRSDQGETTRQRIESLRDIIMSGQAEAGFWSPGGQLPAQKRPLSETTQVSTMLCVLALDSLDKPNGEAIASRDEGLTWLKQTPPNRKSPAVSSEWYALRLVIEKKFGDPKQVEALRDKILSAQHSDGGWGWLWADKSDAFGTGVSVYALSQVGEPSSDAAIQKAWRFLIETQTDNGSWIVNGTKKGTKDKPHPFSSFWGSTWALLGLSHSLPPTKPNESPAQPGGS
jgi:hypothetical protein